MNSGKTKKENVSIEYLLQEYDNLISCESLGFYNCCESISIFLNKKDTQETFHIYTIFFFEERITVETGKNYLLKKPFRISDNYSIGIQKEVKSVEGIREIFVELCKGRDKTVINIGEGELQIGRLECVPKVFVQQNSTKEVILNKVLKNNFKNGSYILEFFDVEKGAKTLLNSLQFKKMASEIYNIIPIDLISVSDRIGNFLFQFPSINSGITYTTDKKEMQLNYHVTIEQRLGEDNQFQLQSEIEYDNNTVGFGAAFCQKGNTDICFNVGDSSHMCKSTLMDLKRQLILARKETTFIRNISMAMHCGTQYGEQRLFYDESGAEVNTLDINSVENIRINQPVVRTRKDSVDSRQYSRRVEELHMQREFRRYGTPPNREEAIKDVIALMNSAENGKVYLWDPYLAVEDLFETWYYTTTFHASLMAITSSEIAEKRHLPIPEWINQQKQFIERRSNHYGVCAELRCQWNGHGYSFHDRFLMVLKEEQKPKVWSLGTSLNSLGKRHHVIQSVEHPQLIVDTFEELWEELKAPECLVWKRGK